MAVETIAKAASVIMKLNNGVTASGVVKTLNLSIGNLNKNYTPATDDVKALIVDLLCECISKSLYRVERTLTSEIATE